MKTKRKVGRPAKAKSKKVKKVVARKSVKKVAKRISKVARKTRRVFTADEIEVLKAKLIESKLPLKDFLRQEKLIKAYTTIYARLRPTGVLSQIPAGKRGRKVAVKRGRPAKVSAVEIPSDGKRGKKSTLTPEFVKSISEGYAASGLTFKEFLKSQKISEKETSKIYQAVHKLRKLSAPAVAEIVSEPAVVETVIETVVETVVAPVESVEAPAAVPETKVAV